MPSILFAEDDEIMRISVSDRLKQYDWQVDEAKNGLIAAEMVEKNQYNLIVSDIRMPGLDGIKLLKKIHEQNTTGPDRRRHIR